MGEYDDLMPQPQATTPSDIKFDDLMPHPQAPSQSKPSSIDFSDLMPKEPTPPAQTPEAQATFATQQGAANLYPKAAPIAQPPQSTQMSPMRENLQKAAETAYSSARGMMFPAERLLRQTQLGKEFTKGELQQFTPFEAYKPEEAQGLPSKAARMAGQLVGGLEAFVAPTEVAGAILSKIPQYTKAFKELAVIAPKTASFLKNGVQNIIAFQAQKQLYTDIATDAKERAKNVGDALAEAGGFAAAELLGEIPKAGKFLEPAALFAIGFGRDNNVPMGQRIMNAAVMAGLKVAGIMGDGKAKAELTTIMTKSGIKATDAKQIAGDVVEQIKKTAEPPPLPKEEARPVAATKELSESELLQKYKEGELTGAEIYDILKTKAEPSPSELAAINAYEYGRSENRSYGDRMDDFAEEYLIKELKDAPYVEAVSKQEIAAKVTPENFDLSLIKNALTEKNMYTISGRMIMEAKTQEARNAIQKASKEWAAKKSVGAATPGEKSFGEAPEAIAAKHAETERIRKQAGFEDYQRAPQTEQEWINAGAEKVKADPMAGTKLVDRINKDPSLAVNEADHVVLNHELARRIDVMNEAAERANRSKTPEEKAQAEADFGVAKDELLKVTDAADVSGTTSGRALKARQLILARDFSQVRMTSKAQAASGDKFTPERAAKVKGWADTIERLQKKIDERLKKIEEADVRSQPKAEKQYPPYIQSLINKIKLLDKSINEFRKKAETPIRNLQQEKEKASARRIDSIKKQIQELYRKIKEPDVRNKEKLQQEISEAEADLLAERKLLQESVAEFRKKAETPVRNIPAEEARAEQAKIDKLNKEIAVLSRKIETADLSQKAKLQAEMSDKVKDLTERKQALSEFISESRRKTQYDQLEAKHIKRLESAIAEQKRMIEQGDVKKDPVRKGFISARVEELQAELDLYRKETEAMRGQAEKAIPNLEAQRAKKAESYKKTLEAQLGDYKRKIDEKDFAKKEKPEPQYDPETLRLKLEVDKIKAAYNLKLAEWTMENKPFISRAFHKLGYYVNLARAIKTSWDFGATGGQGIWSLITHPISTAKAFPKQFQAAWSEAGQARIEAEIRSNPNFELAKKSGIAFTETNGALNRMEEAFMAAGLERIPQWLGGGMVRGSARAYITMLNHLRLDRFNDFVASKGGAQNVTKQEARLIADFVNTHTGRGSLGQRANSMAGLNTLFFAPRWVVSRAQLLTMTPLIKAGLAREKAVSKYIAFEYGKFLGGVALFYSMAKAMGAKINLEDPNSTTFGQIQMGNTYVDPLRGLTSMTTFLSKLGTGSVQMMSGKERTIEFKDIANFVRGKLSPGAGLPLNMILGSDFMGQRVSVAGELGGLVTPMTLADIAQAMMDQGVPKGAAIGVAIVFGMGAKQMDQNKKAPDKRKVGEPRFTILPYGSAEKIQEYIGK